MNQKSLIVIDNDFAVEVDSEEALLTKELIRHYKPRMAEEAKKELSAGSKPNIQHFVVSALKQVNVEFELIAPITCVTVISDMENIGSETPSHEKNKSDSRARTPDSGNPSDC